MGRSSLARHCLLSSFYFLSGDSEPMRESKMYSLLPLPRGYAWYALHYWSATMIALWRTSTNTSLIVSAPQLLGRQSFNLLVKADSPRYRPGTGGRHCSSLAGPHTS